MRCGWVFVSLNSVNLVIPFPCLGYRGKEKQKYILPFAAVVLWVLRQKCSSCNDNSGILGKVGMSSSPLAFAKGKKQERKRGKERKKREKKE